MLHKKEEADTERGGQRNLKRKKKKKKRGRDMWANFCMQKEELTKTEGKVRGCLGGGSKWWRRA